MAVGEFDLSGKFIKIQKLANNLNILQMLAFKNMGSINCSIFYKLFIEVCVSSS